MAESIYEYLRLIIYAGVGIITMVCGTLVITGLAQSWYIQNNTLLDEWMIYAGAFIIIPVLGPAMILDKAREKVYEQKISGK